MEALKSSLLRTSVLILTLQIGPVLSQYRLPNSYPHAYPGQPSDPLGPQWQQYYLVTEQLPNVTFPLGRLFAGNIPVGRANHPNNTLFFIGAERQEGSITTSDDQSRNDPWGIWLNGGPGASSMFGLFYENGPVRIEPDLSASPNDHSWSNLADYFWVDQPVGIGYSTAESAGYDEDQVGQDFMGFLGNLVKVFPGLATRPLYLTGESYAGQYIPYILKAYFGMASPPVNVAKIAIGDGSMTSLQVFALAPTLSVIETFPQLIGYDQSVYQYFKEQTSLCGYDMNLTYPQESPIPNPLLNLGAEPSTRHTLLRELHIRSSRRHSPSSSTDSPRELWKRSLHGRPSGVIDPWYGCDLLNMLVDYAVNFTYPWSLAENFRSSFNYYDVPDASDPKINYNPSVFLNDPRTRAALHAPTSKDWDIIFPWTFNGTSVDPSPMAITFFDELAANASSRGVGFVFFCGNDDALVPHLGTEIAIQNTTFGGIRGFTRKPSTRWFNDAGEFGGVVHQERGWAYVLVYDASHMVPQSNPISGYTLLREFILGNNQTGTVTNVNGVVSVVGGEDPTLEGIIRGPDEIYHGHGATLSTYVFPQATREAWNSFMNPPTIPQPSGSQSIRKNTRPCRDLFLSFFAIVIAYLV